MESILVHSTQTGTERSLLTPRLEGSPQRHTCTRVLLAILAPFAFLAAGCSGGMVAANSSPTSFSIASNSTSIDTNCTGCNATSAMGRGVQRFSTTLPGSEGVAWQVTGGDPVRGPGLIGDTGEYTPPSYLTADRVHVVVTATLPSGVKASSVLTVTPGFLQPLTPENVALGASGQVTITGYLAEAGGSTGIHFALAGSASGTTGGLGSLSAPTCQRDAQAFTWCRVTYTAPATIPATGATYVVATAGGSQATTATEVLLNTAGVSSNPAAHQAQMPAQMLLGTSGGNNNDYDTRGNLIVDCCSGTLGALLEDSGGRQFLLSNNHVLARSDQAGIGDAIVQPGLIDNNCTPLGDSSAIMPVASLTGWLPLSSPATNADAAIAQVASRAVDPSGRILELGLRRPDGTLAAAAPGISSTGGKGEAAWLDQQVAKSGRTTGLTCGSVSALDLDVNVDYFRDCAETRPYLTKTFTGQLAISGNTFSDAGDSGALVVDAGNAEPVGLYFAGGTDVNGVSHAVANPAPDILNELSAQAGGRTSYTFVGGADHAVSCLNYGDNTVAAAQSRKLADADIVRAQQALAQARALVNPAVGILGVATGKSNDAPGEAAVLLYVDESMTVNAPPEVGGVRTVVIPTTAHEVAFGSAPETPSISAAPPLPPTTLNLAIALKQQVVRSLMNRNPAFFGLGVGQSLDNPREAALIIYVDRKLLPTRLPQSVGSLRTRYVVMDRLHVTRSYSAPFTPAQHCMAHTPDSRSTRPD